ncbi:MULTISPECIES: hypothetical protein [unclassified Bradyrhizobium]|uniref:hypothetical protein n=1 Tax=unclassified Bradyrhizobium TaxID=2631580 RepID=UPI00244B7E3A|nr:MULTISPECIES: hypothetical protein [unclassified Bradyrhizobium]MDH2341433.1 hypothetical protein [Bradyrhizobium sp. SSUT77]MDH2354834.1 hypothetical protein [Bradyrhizobium sp. SSUT112]
MSTSKKPLKPNDFPVTAEGQQSRSKTASPSPVPSIQKLLPTERINDDEARREEDKWSA